MSNFTNNPFEEGYVQQRRDTEWVVPFDPPNTRSLYRHLNELVNKADLVVGFSRRYSNSPSFVHAHTPEAALHDCLDEALSCFLTSYFYPEFLQFWQFLAEMSEEQRKAYIDEKCRRVRQSQQSEEVVSPWPNSIL
ncbi:MAG: hypothetical protein LBH14_01680 [Desulfobulbaceae bacterium]|jgi:hypothetical protein|nr:hypothetical protein [Desulfobulbaceae bacterium]